MKVVSNTAVSLDGRINTRERRFTFFGSARDHARMSRLRAGADAVLVGGATFRNWPHAALPDPPDRPLLKARPWNVVVSRSLDVPLAPSFLAEPGIRPLPSLAWWTASPHCLRLFMSAVRAAASRTFCTAGSSNPMSTAMIAMTTKSSISVKPMRRAGMATLKKVRKEASSQNC